MVVLKAIGRFFAKIGRWIRDTAWVQPLLIVGGIFAIIFSIPKIIEVVDTMNEESNAAQTFFEKNEISAQGKEDYLSKDSTLDKFLSVLEEDNSDVEATYKKVNDVLKVNSKQFFIIFVDSSSTCDSLYGGLNYLKNNWNNSEFAEGVNGTTFTYRTIYIDTVDKYDESTVLFDDCWSRHTKGMETLASDLYNTQFAQNKGYDEESDGHYDKLSTDASEFKAGTMLYFNYEADAFDGVTTAGLRSCTSLADITGTGDYEKAQTLYSCWIEEDKSIFGSEYVRA